MEETPQVQTFEQEGFLVTLCEEGDSGAQRLRVLSAICAALHALTKEE